MHSVRVLVHPSFLDSTNAHAPHAAAEKLLRVLSWTDGRDAEYLERLTPAACATDDNNDDPSAGTCLESISSPPNEGVVITAASSIRTAHPVRLEEISSASTASVPQEEACSNADHDQECGADNFVFFTEHYYHGQGGSSGYPLSQNMANLVACLAGGRWVFAGVDEGVCLEPHRTQTYLSDGECAEGGLVVKGLRPVPARYRRAFMINYLQKCALSRPNKYFPGGCANLQNS